MQNISNPPAAGTLTPALEGAPCSASHENRSIPVISPPQGENTPCLLYTSPSPRD